MTYVVDVEEVGVLNVLGWPAVGNPKEFVLDNFDGLTQGSITRNSGFLSAAVDVLLGAIVCFVVGA